MVTITRMTITRIQLIKARTSGKGFSFRLQINGNATISPFLKLPGEVKEILRLVVGGQVIHVRLSHCKGCGFGRESTCPYTKLRYVLCVATVSETKRTRHAARLWYDMRRAPRNSKGVAGVSQPLSSLGTTCSRFSNTLGEPTDIQRSKFATFATNALSVDDPTSFEN